LDIEKVKADVIFSSSFGVFSTHVIQGASIMEQLGFLLLPAFVLASVNVRDFGAIGNGETLNTDAIQELIDKACEDGGGVVYFPPRDYLTGTIQLRDNVTLYLEAGATIWGSKDRKDYKKGCLIYAVAPQ
jgi:hypothetical protein